MAPLLPALSVCITVGSPGQVVMATARTLCRYQLCYRQHPLAAEISQNHHLAMWDCQLTGNLIIRTLALALLASAIWPS
jgi:hypothetical protein